MLQAETIQQREEETRGRRGKHKQKGTETIGDLWKGEGRVKQDGHYKEFEGGGLTGVEKMMVLDG